MTTNANRAKAGGSTTASKGGSLLWLLSPATPDIGSSGLSLNRTTVQAFCQHEDFLQATPWATRPIDRSCSQSAVRDKPNFRALSFASADQ